MSQIMTLYKAILACAVLLVLVTGCGTPNDNASFDSDAEAHTGAWISDHAVTAKADTATCVECHGASLDGGISKVSCTSCHLGGPTAIHPSTYTSPVALNHSEYVAIQGNSGCANINCHGATLAGGLTGPSCSSCHIGGPTSFHPVDWAASISTKHGEYVEINGTQSCASLYCHGADLLGVVNSSPSCKACHAMPDSL
jgi:hypothetical protein